VSKLFYNAPQNQLGWLNPPHSDAIQPHQRLPNTIWWRIRKISRWQCMAQEELPLAWYSTRRSADYCARQDKEKTGENG